MVVGFIQNPLREDTGMLPARSTVKIDLMALEHNVSVLEKQCKSSQICAVVKANAYGHGAIRVAQKLKSLGIQWYAVSSLYEGIELREGGIKEGNILMFGNDCFDNLDILHRYDITPVVYSLECLIKLCEIPHLHQKIHIELDTGMTRTGLSISEIPEAVRLIKQSPDIDVQGLFTHFACADQEKDNLTEEQLKSFESAIDLFAGHDIRPRYIHAANSAGILTTAGPCNLVRPGLLLYGVSPLSSAIKTGVRPILSWHSKILQIKQVSEGQSISYGATWTASRASKIAVIPVGYADGYPRLASNRGFVLIHDCKVPIVGNICMDYMMLDVTDCRDVTLNSDVVLVGMQGKDEITLDDIAGWAKTIAYEIMCNAGKRSSYCYMNGENK